MSPLLLAVAAPLAFAGAAFATPSERARPWLVDPLPQAGGQRLAFLR